MEKNDHPHQAFKKYDTELFKHVTQATQLSIPLEIMEATPNSGEYRARLRIEDSDSGLMDVKTVGEKTYLNVVFEMKDAWKNSYFDHNYFVDEIDFETDTGKKYWVLATDFCKPCEPEKLACIGPQLQQCNTEGNGWSFVEECYNGCEDAACVPPCTPGEQKCEGGFLQKCTEKGIWKLDNLCP